MGSTNSLKHRFEKLQKASLYLTEDIVLDTVVTAEPPKLELQVSSYPEVHEKVRQASSLNYDWKKQYKQLFKRPTLDTGRSKAMTQFEGKIQDLTTSVLIVSFSQNQQLDAALVKTLAHMASDNSLWKTILNNAQNLHFSSEKNKIHLTIKYENHTRDLKAELKKKIEKEYLSDTSSIKTFHLAGHDDWIDLILELTSVNNGRRAEESSI